MGGQIIWLGVLSESRYNARSVILTKISNNAI